MAELLITLIGLALFGTGWLGMLRPGTGAQPDRVARILQVITGLIMMIIGAVFITYGVLSASPPDMPIHEQNEP
ncbi:MULTISPECIES: hypothetical protein [Hyphomonas]|uniref:Uncharacterized protein n=1 Tax=Hyphomonas adhaerens TaxID=81029 RepID=A0A3B9GZX1_9PROT|nr:MULTISPECIES: hypothetical protein [Hyphomonas]MBB40996.1 hypothetical protein [Hyphomonas sp.]HAE27999.1 hypothetical protein [Hyphomonas adhaerens]